MASSILLVALSYSVPPPENAPTPGLVAKSLQAIHQAPGQAWSLDELARVAGLSLTALATTFSRLMETTPLAYLTQWRMQIARKQLRESDAPIINIAEQVGFRPGASFIREWVKAVVSCLPQSQRGIRDFLRVLPILAL